MVWWMSAVVLVLTVYRGSGPRVQECGVVVAVWLIEGQVMLVGYIRPRGWAEWKP
jgi:hypothetical protein